MGSSDKENGSPSFLDELRRYRFQGRGFADSSDDTDSPRTPRSPASFQKSELAVIPETPNSHGSSCSTGCVDSSSIDGGARQKGQPMSPTTSSSESPIVNGIKRKAAVIEESDDESPSFSGQKNEEGTSAYDDQFLTEKERKLKLLMEAFPFVDLMDIQDVLRKYDWSVSKSLEYLHNNFKVRREKKPRTDKVKDESPPRVDNVEEENDSLSYKDKIVSKFQKINQMKKHAPVEKKEKKAKKKFSAVDYQSDEEFENDYAKEGAYDSDSENDDDIVVSTKDSLKDVIVSFFQNATLSELVSLPGCSKKKAEQILQAKPFKHWNDLVDKFKNSKTLSVPLISAAKELLYTREVVSRLMDKCMKISESLKKMVEDILEGNESEAYIQNQPSILNKKFKLAPYQMIGLNWLYLMHQQEVNGILADEMGLGKTIQVIAFLAHLLEKKEDTPHLIVVPSSTIENWMREISTWCPSLTYIIYHGSQEERKELRYQILGDELDFNVLITTYHMITSNSEDRSIFKKIGFHYVVFDEAHMLKNMASQRYQHLMKIQAKRKLLLTGTPLQNNLVELMSLLTFVMPHMFSPKADHIKMMFSSVTKGDQDKNQFENARIQHAKNIMQPFILRRLKSDVLQQLPKKFDCTTYCDMTDAQKKLYRALIEKFAKQRRENREEGKSNRCGSAVMMELRKAANHPLLIRHHYDDEALKEMSRLMLKESTHTNADPILIQEDMSVMSDFELHRLCQTYKALHPYQLPDDLILESGKFRELDSILEDFKQKGFRVLLFSQFTMILDIMEEYMKLRKTKFLRLDGQTPVTERQDLIDKYNNEDIFVFLLSTKAGGLGINLTAANVVIIHDLDFNPYNDKQAEDRCHRVGQTRDVHVVKLISKESVEEGILQIAQDKLKLERDISENNSSVELEDGTIVSLLKSALGC